MKYDKMLEAAQAESQRKMDVAKQTISGMLDNMERITVAELVRRTGLSRGFFYKNPKVRRELDDAIHKQEVILKNRNPVMMDKKPEDTIINLRLELSRAAAENEELAAQNQKLLKRNEQLCQQIEKLQKQLERKEISLLKRL